MSSDQSVAQAPNRKPKRQLKTTSDIDRERIVKAYENGAHPSTIAQILDIPRSTVYGILKRYKTEWQIEAKKRGGNRVKALSPEAVESIRVWFAAERKVTLRELVEKVHAKYGLRLSTATIGKEVKDLKAAALKGKSIQTGVSKPGSNLRTTEAVKDEAQTAPGNVKNVEGVEKSILKSSNKA